MPAEILPVITTTFKPEKHIPVEGASIIIKETSREASLKSVKLVSLGTEAVGLKFDLCGFPGDKVFNTPDLQRACDAIVFCQFQGEGYILCCELKSSEPTRNEATVQFRSSLCFTDYVESVLKNYHHLSIHGLDNHGRPAP